MIPASLEAWLPCRLGRLALDSTDVCVEIHSTSGRAASATRPRGQPRPPRNEPRSPSTPDAPTPTGQGQRSSEEGHRESKSACRQSGERGEQGGELSASAPSVLDMIEAVHADDVVDGGADADELVERSCSYPLRVAPAAREKPERCGDSFWTLVDPAPAQRRAS